MDSDEGFQAFVIYLLEMFGYIQDGCTIAPETIHTFELDRTEVDGGPDISIYQGSAVALLVNIDEVSLFCLDALPLLTCPGSCQRRS